MPLFQQSVLKKYTNDLNKQQLQHTWKSFQKHFFNPDIQQNIRNSKEEEYQEGFVRDLFVNVLGYTLNPQPNYNFVLEKKTVTDATKSDGAILLNGEVTGVVELKDTGTPDLDKVSNQAFGYKHKHKNCIYVVTSNFEKLRFYINDSTDFEEFDLFRLTQERFAVLFLCLHQQNIASNIPLQIKQQSLVQEENVTRKLYADYSLFKRKLFQNIAEQNSQHDKLLLFKKTQKLLDRFLFIFFAEDRLLLPPNSVREILHQWEQLKELDNYVPLYDRFKKYFGYLNVGHVGKHHEIFAYNGGLFLPDEVLDAIVIDDTILFNGTKALSNYDFETDVDVNILGHIFEHSLTEIEELQLELEGKAIEKSKTKRKKEGVFYTPGYITKYIVENTVGALCKQKKDELQINEEAFAPQKRKANRKSLLDVIGAYRQWLLGLTICDPACGSGAFLNAALQYLQAEHKTLDELTARMLGEAMVFSDLDNSILENNLYGVDINEDAIEIAKLSLWLHTAKKGRKLSNLSNNIKCGNSLIDDPKVAGEKALNWKEEFKNVFDNGGFDVVIGNPPYVRIQNLKRVEVDYYFKYFATPNGKLDLSILFFEKALSIVNDSGLIAFISSSQWMQTDYGKNIRKILANGILKKVVDFGSLPVFEDADTYPAIFELSNKEADTIIFKSLKEKSQLDYEQILLAKELHIHKSTLSDEAWSISSFNVVEHLLEKEINFLKIEEIGGSYIGDLTGMDKAFVVNKETVNRLKLEKEILYPYAYRGEDIFSYTPVNPSNYVIYPYLDNENGKAELITEMALEKKFPNIYSYLKSFRSELTNRLDSRKYYAINDWYRHLRQGSFNYIKPSKLLFKGIGTKSTVGILAENTIFNGANCPAIIIDNKEFDYRFILCILNSSLATYFLNSICPKKLGGYYRYNASNIADIPIAVSSEQQPFIDKADIMLSKNKELNQLSEQFTDLLQAKFPAININNKLQSWYSLSASDFLKELGKQKIKLSLSDQQEWLQYFSQQKEKANNIQQLIQQTDKEIDTMVYALYGLTDEEIAIVEGK